MNDDEVLARVLRRYLISYEFWELWEGLGGAELDLDLAGSVELSPEEAAVIAKYRR